VLAARRRELDEGHAGIAGLHGAEQALLGGHQESRAVDVDAAAFEHQVRTPTAHLEVLGYGIRHGVVVLPVVVLGPSVEAPIGDGYLALRAFQEERAVVPRPDAIGGAADEI